MLTTRPSEHGVQMAEWCSPTFSACVWPTALKLGCVTNFDMLFLVMRFISLVDEIQLMLISSHHISIKSIKWRPELVGALRIMGDDSFK